MTHPTDRAEAMREALKFYASMSSWTLTPREGTARTMHLSDAEIDMGKRARDALALPLPARDDAVREAMERFTEAARASMDANFNGGAFDGGPGEAAGLDAAAKCMDAYRALLAAERAQGEKGGE